MWLAAIASVFTSSRVVMACGFTTVAIGCWMAAGLDSSWAGDSFRWAETMIAAGLGVAFVGLAISLVLAAFEMGAVTNALNAATFSGCMHTMRLLGGEIGAVCLTHYLTVQQRINSNLIGLHVQSGDGMTVERLRGLTASLVPIMGSPSDAESSAFGLLNLQVRAQAYTLATRDAFLLICGLICSYLFLLVFLRRNTIDLKQLGKKH